MPADGYTSFLQQLCGILVPIDRSALRDRRSGALDPHFVTKIIDNLLYPALYDLDCAFLARKPVTLSIK